MCSGRLFSKKQNAITVAAGEEEYFKHLPDDLFALLQINKVFGLSPQIDVEVRKNGQDNIVTIRLRRQVEGKYLVDFSVFQNKIWCLSHINDDKLGFISRGNDEFGYASDSYTPKECVNYTKKETKRLIEFLEENGIGKKHSPELVNENSKKAHL